MTAGPWRLDALEILRVNRAAGFDRSHILPIAKALVASDDTDPELRDKLRALTATIESHDGAAARTG